MTGVYYYQEEAQYGPIEITQLISLYSEGVVDLNTLVWMETMTEWMILANSPIYPQIQATICPPPPVTQPATSTNTTKSRNSVKFVLESIDYRKSVRQKSSRVMSQRTVSQRLTRSSLFDPSKNIWIEDPKEAWVMSSIIHQDNTLLAVQNLQTNEKSIIDTGFQDVFIANDKVVSDMSSLNYMHEPAILYNLEQRFLSSLPYTYMGLVLLAVNPLRPLPQPLPSDFISKSLNPELPHPYAIAELCCQELDLKNSKDQSVVISGESGSGKTETAKLVLHHLVSRSQSSDATDRGRVINDRLLQSSPVLEAFGNSKTSRNPNSSRFGKFMKIFMSDPEPLHSRGRHIEGALIETYLLEKGRVIGQTHGEQNFHIFYQLLSSLDRLETSLPSHIFPPASPLLGNGNGHLRGGSYRIVNSSETPLEVLRQSFLETSNALAVIGYSADLVSDVWKILGAILLFGNIIFDEEDSPEGAIAILSEESKIFCHHACQLLGLSSSSSSSSSTAAAGAGAPGAAAGGGGECGAGEQSMSVEEMLTQKVMMTRGEKFILKLTTSDASYARDAFCKAIYEALFAQIVISINTGLVHTSPTQQTPPTQQQQQQFIGVLDVFGFESFEVNGFDQLLINYANEALQNTFNTQVFRSELKLFQEERIACPLDLTSCPDNTACIETLWTNPNTSAVRTAPGSGCSVLGILDTICRQPKPSDAKFCSQLHKDLSKKTMTNSTHFPAPHPKDKHNSFLIKHFAGLVKYTVGSTVGSGGGSGAGGGGGGEDKVWIDRNNDSMPDSLWTVLSQSSCPLMKKLFLTQTNATEGGIGAAAATAAGGAAGGSRKQLNKPTIATSFSKSIQSLTQKLEATNCSFIRCIKPNAAMTPTVFEKRYVVEQMRALGLVQACEVMSVGLPNRISYLDLKESLSLSHVTQEAEEIFVSEPEEVLISALLMSCEVPPDSYRLGKTRIFFRSGHLSSLEQKIRSVVSREDKRSEMISAMRRVKAMREEMISSLNELKNKLRECEHQKVLVREEVQTFQQTLSSSLSSSLSSGEGEGEGLPSLSLLQSQLTIGMEELRTHLTSSVENLMKVERQLAFPSPAAPSASASASAAASVLSAERTNLITQFSQTKANFNDLQMKVQSLESQQHSLETSLRLSSAFSVSSSWTDHALDRWQEISRLEELLEGARGLTKDAELASLQFQTQRTDELVTSCHDKFAEILALAERIRSELREDLSKMSQSQSETKEFAKLATGMLRSLEDLGTSCEEIFVSCQELLKIHEALLLREKELQQQEQQREHEKLQKQQQEKEKEEEENERKRREMEQQLKMERERERQEREREEQEEEEERRLAASARRGSVRVTKAMMQDLSLSIPSPAVASVSAAVASPTQEEESEVRQRSGTSSTDLLSPISIIETWILPEGWEEYYDATQGLPYYFNSITQATQWERPEGPACSLGGEMLPLDSPAAVSVDVAPTAAEAAAVERAPERAPEGAIDHSHGELSAAVTGVLTATSGASGASRGVVAKCNLAYGRITTAQLSSFGSEVKTGYLMKRSSGLMGRWKKKFFVLDGAILSYFEKAQHFTYGSGGSKEMRLSITSSTAFTDTDCTFIVKSFAAGASAGEEISWMLVAETPASMREWVAFINAHIHALHCRLVEAAETEATAAAEEDNAKRDRGETEKISFWCLLPSCRNPVGVRSLPRTDGPRTGEGIYPGEYVEIVQTLQTSSNTYLKLAEDRGWVFTTHPVHLTELFVKFTAYRFQHPLLLHFKVDQAAVPLLPSFLSAVPYPDAPLLLSFDLSVAPQTEGIAIYFSPGNDSPATGSFLNPKEEIEICGLWELLLSPQSQSPSQCRQFGKLLDGRGWIPMTAHSPTGECLLQPLVRNPLSR